MQKLKLSVLILFLIFDFLKVHTQEWTQLYDGTTLQGWEHVGDGSFVIEDGLLKTQGGMGLLWYTRHKFENVKIRVIFRGMDKNNAGVFIRIPEQPTEAWMPVNRGYEVQIDDREDDYHKTGVLYSLTKAMATPTVTDDWNIMDIVLHGDSTQVYINDVLVTDYNEGDPVPEKKKDYEPDRGRRPTAGYIGLQNHGGEDVILFKEVSYQKLK
jgi:hypothetical protein